MNNYWQIRERDLAYNAALGLAEANLSSEYKRCFKALKRQIADLYDELLLETKETILISDLYKYNRYYELMNAINANLLKLGEKEIKINDKILTDFYLTNVQLITDELGLYKGSQVFVDEISMKTAINAIWCQDGKHWSDRIWANKQALQKRIEKGLVDCIARGTTKIDLLNDLEKNINIGFNEADRLIRTEMTFIQNQATLNKYREAGIEKYKYLAFIDSRTSTVCENLNGKVFELNKASVGVNYPPLHPNCRSTVLAVL